MITWVFWWKSLLSLDSSDINIGVPFRHNPFTVWIITSRALLVAWLKQYMCMIKRRDHIYIIVKFLGFILVQLLPNLQWPGTLTPKDARDNSFQHSCIYFSLFVNCLLVGSSGWKPSKHKKNKKLYKCISNNLNPINKVNMFLQCT